jgi:hypothetical protein
MFEWPNLPGTTTPARMVSCGICAAYIELTPRLVKEDHECHIFPKNKWVTGCFDCCAESICRVLVFGCVVFVIVGGVGVALPFQLERTGASPLLRACHYAFAYALSLGTFFVYMMTVYCAPGRPPIADAPRIAAVRRMLGDSLKGCRICLVCDPPRLKLPGTSHLSQSGYCVMRYEHHCIFVGADVGLWNHRAYVAAAGAGGGWWAVVVVGNGGGGGGDVGWMVVGSGGQRGAVGGQWMYGWWEAIRPGYWYGCDCRRCTGG